MDTKINDHLLVPTIERKFKLCTSASNRRVASCVSNSLLCFAALSAEVESGKTLSTVKPEVQGFITGG